MVSYPLIKEGQRSHKYAFLRASGAMLLRLGASLWVPPKGEKMVSYPQANKLLHHVENGLVPPCSILLDAMCRVNAQVIFSRDDIVIAEENFTNCRIA